jgi:uncharacterized protein (DUF362 family)
MEPARVSIVRAPGYDADLLSVIRELIVDHDLEVRNKRVVLKPNLVEFDPGTPINTNPIFVEAVLEAFRSLGAAEVRIAEGPGHRRGTLDMADQAGYFQSIPGFESIFTDLNLDAVTEVPLKVRHSKIASLYLPNTVLGCDLLVSLPKLKTHHWVGATLSMKNLFGLVPGGVYGWPKNNLHWNGINESIADLHGTTPSQFAIVDGIVGMEGNGPIQGSPKSAGVLVAGADPVAVDCTCCRIMGINPERIDYIKLADSHQRRLEANVVQIGETIASVQTRFELLPIFEGIRLGQA